MEAPGSARDCDYGYDCGLWTVRRTLVFRSRYRTLREEENGQ